ncbi:DMT family transporter [Saccharicrinis fermentans]|uniref:Phosphonate utilization associated putative membrane protein n=1 Tax=Saccharicrinis fermentans DSM 9555 = JCM 21142 TaxID=869213 RepID=W7Y112_9BACT|nr:DMT family transporter [Saccharicrinis fermentans]GAF04615.1 phosphonate utilization associated putative membrane protein [Saccharicrinis fermentans DSM 9555 = JCM 21142]
MWWLLAIVSALFLGIYDVVKKVSLNNNAVLPVLLFSSLSGAILFVPLWLASQSHFISSDHLFFIPSITLKEHAMLLLKSMIVVTSWIFSFFALKHLPLTIVSPVRATGPLWTLIGAIIIFSERLTTYQWIGIIITLAFFYLFSIAGKTEGISFRRNKWILFLILGTLFGAVSGLYDKFLLQHINRMAVQCYFTFYQVILFVPLVMVIWWPTRKKTSPFIWRWSIPLIGFFLIVADFFYFYALHIPESMISIVSALRRASVIVAFAFGAYLFKEKNIKTKALYLLGILVGIGLLIFGTSH